MENMMKHKRRLVNENELPQIHFALNKNAIEKQDSDHLAKQEPFFRSYFDKDMSRAPDPDI